MPATSRSSGPSTRRATSSSTSFFNCIGALKTSPGLGCRQRAGDPVFGDRFRLVGRRFRRRFGGRLDIRTNAQVGGCALGDGFENRSGGFATIVTLRVRFIEEDGDANLRVVGGKETDERRKVLVRAVGRLLAGAGLARDGIMLE